MNDPQLGIIVLNWNGLSDSRACLRSLFGMRGPAPHVYVVDNASTDGSVEVLRGEFGDRIVLLLNARNLLYAGGNNVGIRRALEDGCSHVLLLNNDTTADPELGHALMTAAQEVGDALLCPKIYYGSQPTTLWYAGGRLSLRRARAAHRGIREMDRGQYERREETGWATGCALFASQKVFETVGLLDEDFELYSEDLDFSLRAKQAGFPVFYVPAGRVWHKVSASLGGNLSRRKLVRKWKSLRRLLKKHLPNPWLRAIALTDFMLTEPPRVLWAALRGRL